MRESPRERWPYGARPLQARPNDRHGNRSQVHHMLTWPPTICLNMIVKNEAHVIARCLDSVRPFIDSWMIVDTGSTDGTQDRIRSLFHSDLPGELHERPWKNFGHNRNEAQRLRAGRQITSSLSTRTSVSDLPAGRARLPHRRRIHLRCEFVGTTYMRCALVATRLPWRWTGVVHEFLECDAPFHLETLEGPTIVIAHDGARSRDPLIYAKDAALLEHALRTDPDNARICLLPRAKLSRRRTT